MQELTIIIPYPPADASPNNPVHWSRRARARKEQKAQLEVILRAKCFKEKIKRPLSKTMVIVHYTVHTPKKLSPIKTVHKELRKQIYVPRDRDNCIAAMKAVQDALQSVGLVEDDKIVHLKNPTILNAKESSINGVEMRIMWDED